jgi:hypothetical protein
MNSVAEGRAHTRRAWPKLGARRCGEPLGYVDGMSLYEYCRANPANLTDPSGLCSGTAPDANETDWESWNNYGEDAALYDANWEEWNNSGEDSEPGARSQGTNSAVTTQAPYDYTRYRMAIQKDGIVYLGDGLNMAGDFVTQAQTPKYIKGNDGKTMVFDESTMVYRPQTYDEYRRQFWPLPKQAGAGSEGPELVVAKVVNVARDVCPPLAIGCSVIESVGAILSGLMYGEWSYYLPTGGESNAIDMDSAMGTTNRTIRNNWEEINEKPWPKDPNNHERNQDVSHKDARADGGTDDLSNIEPKPHAEHVADHMKKGDFKRWGARAGRRVK